MSSIGTQAVWILTTWFLWIFGAAIVNLALPRLLVNGSCAGLVYCGQIQTLFGVCFLGLVCMY